MKNRIKKKGLRLKEISVVITLLFFIVASTIYGIISFGNITKRQSNAQELPTQEIPITTMNNEPTTQPVQQTLQQVTNGASLYFKSSQQLIVGIQGQSVTFSRATPFQNKTIDYTSVTPFTKTVNEDGDTLVFEQGQSYIVLEIVVTDTLTQSLDTQKVVIELA